jgi:hypothetical protein
VTPPQPPAPVDHAVRIVVTPEGAHVRHDEHDLGDAPLTLTIPAAQQWSLQITAPGFQPREILVDGRQSEVTAHLDPVPRAPAVNSHRAAPHGERHATEPAPTTTTTTPANPTTTTPTNTPPSNWNNQVPSDNRNPWAH